MPTNIDLVRDLVSSAKVTSKPSGVGGGRRHPMYAPMVQLVLNKAPDAVAFGPVTGTDNRRDAERIRTGCHSYITDHPEMLPEGKQMRFSVREDVDGYWLTGWVEDAA